MDPVRNPYNPGAGTRPRAFTGRDSLIDAVDILLQRAKRGLAGKSLLPIGLRGVGKTVLLNRFTDLAEERGFKVAFIEATEAGRLPTQLAYALRKILLEYDLLGNLSEKVRRALRILTSFTYTLPDRSTISMGFDPERGSADSGNLAEDLIDVLVAVGEAARDRDGGVLIAIDEVQYLSEHELGAVIVAMHRAAQRELPVVLVAAGLPQLPALAGEAKSYAERLFEFPEIGALPPDAARAAVLLPAVREEVEFTDDALTAILDVTERYPYFLQEWAYVVWNHAERSPITADDVRAATPAVLQRLDESFFRVRFDRLTQTERKYLRAMAELGPGSHRTADIAEMYGAKIQSVAPLRAGLIAKGMIYSPQYGDMAFTVPLFDAFLRRTMPFEKR